MALNFLKEKGLIQLKSSRKEGKYIVTEKYLTFKQKLNNE